MEEFGTLRHDVVFNLDPPLLFAVPDDYEERLVALEDLVVFGALVGVIVLETLGTLVTSGTPSTTRVTLLTIITLDTLVTLVALVNLRGLDLLLRIRGLVTLEGLRGTGSARC